MFADPAFALERLCLKDQEWVLIAPLWVGGMDSPHISYRDGVLAASLVAVDVASAAPHPKPQISEQLALHGRRAKRVHRARVAVLCGEIRERPPGRGPADLRALALGEWLGGIRRGGGDAVLRAELADWRRQISARRGAFLAARVVVVKGALHVQHGVGLPNFEVVHVDVVQAVHHVLYLGQRAAPEDQVLVRALVLPVRVKYHQLEDHLVGADLAGVVAATCCRAAWPRGE
mmetsp:Transcript_10847/g.27434  ORF Transcript_10847/g.27434 Transcript_10847/m.27434 type:complete len:232 (-) Transcript_10847:900-1595(-)